MQHISISDTLDDLSARYSYAWISDVIAFFERPDVLALLYLACIGASWRATRSPRRTLAFAIVMGVAGALIYVADLVSPTLAVVLMPLCFLTAMQALYWGGTRGHRLEWLWEGVPKAASEQLLSGTLAATVGFVILTTTMAIATANPNLDEGMRLSPLHGPSAMDWAYALVGIVGLVTALPVLWFGGVAMLKGSVGVVRTITTQVWRNGRRRSEGDHVTASGRDTGAEI